MGNLLELRDISARYGRIQVLFDVSLSVARGEALAIVGPNGAGKTTVLRTISGFLRPLGGSIVFDGAEIAGSRPDETVRLGLAQVLQGRRIVGAMTVYDNLLLGAHLRLGRRSRRDVAASLETVYALFPVLAERAQMLAGSLSGGEQQMLAVARALMSRPEVLLLDEPSMGLAPFVIEGIMQTLRQLKSDGLTLILVEQNPDLAAQISDRVCIMETGRVVEVGGLEVLADRERVAFMYLGGGAPGSTPD